MNYGNQEVRFIKQQQQLRFNINQSYNLMK